MDRIEPKNDCLVLVPDGLNVDPRLLAEMAHRGLHPELRHDAAAVMAELALRGLAVRTQNASDQVTVPYPSIIVVRPDRWLWHNELVTAIGQYLPMICVYISDDGQAITRHISSQPVLPEETPLAIPPPNARPATPDRAITESQPFNQDEPAERLSLSQEEIAMLLDSSGEHT